MNSSFNSRFRAILHSAQDIFLIFSKCWLSIIMLLAGSYAFLLNDQGQDIVTAFNGNGSFGMSLATALCMLFWGVESWFGARLALDLSDITALNKKQESKLAIWLPRILGFLSTAVFYISYLIFNENQWTSDRIILFLPLIVYWIVIVYRRNLIRKWNKSSNTQIQTNTIKNEAIKYEEVTRHRRWFFKLSLILFPVLIIVICIFPVTFPTLCSPTIIILLGIAVWTGLATAFMVYEKRLKIPLVLIAIAAIFIFSFINNNHSVRTVCPTAKPVSIENAISKWVNQLPTDSGKIKTIYIACGEGGGIRAAYWTASVLASLTDSVSDFPKHLFAMSTVSGSSLGASAYNSILKYNNKKDSVTKQVRNFMKEDYLSPVAAAFLFPDALQRILFFPVGHFDRARYLEWSWEQGWANNFPNGMNSFKEGMQTLWNDSSNTLPNLFLNSTHTESGRRTVVSNLSWCDKEWRSDNVTILMGKDMPLSSSTLLSARFPVLTPGAKISDTSECYWGTLVDGGYYDNYGTVTAANLYYDIRKVYKPKDLRIVVLMILNGDSVPQDPKPIKCAYELLTVPSTFLNAWTVRPENSLEMLSKILCANKDTVITVKLGRNKSENLPLGWCLSDKAMNIMDNQLKSPNWHVQKKQIIDLMQR